MNDMLRRIVLLVFAAVLAAPAADIALGDGWSERRSPGAAGSSEIAPGSAVLSGERGRFVRVERPLGLDGSDQRPLRVQCAIAVTGVDALSHEPALMTLAWKGALIAVGIANTDKGSDGRRPVARWVIDGKPGEAFGDLDLYPDSCPSHVRIVIVSRDVSAWASRDGWTWQRLATFSRGTAFSGTVATVALGKGWPSEGLSLDRDVKADARQLATLHFSDFLATDAAPEVPASLLKNYQKAASRDDALEAMFLAGLPRQWWLSGPFPDQRGKLEQQAIAAFDAKAEFEIAEGKRVGWTELRIDDTPSARIVVASEVIKGGDRAVRYAATTVVCDQPRLERLLFDGGRQITLFVNGRPIAAETVERGEEVAPDRLTALAPLVAGSNTIVIRLVGDDRGRSAFTFRHEPGDALRRIALLRRLAIDFPEDPDAQVAAQLEISRRWEGLGCLQQAALALGELVAIEDAAPEQIESALIESARLHAALRDDAAVATDITTLSRRWAEQSSDQLAAHRKAASLWMRMGQPAKALAVLGEAAAVPGMAPLTRLHLGLERLRLLTSVADEAGVLTELRALAAALPAGDARRADLLAELAARSPLADVAVGAVAGSWRAQRRLAGALAQRGDRAGSLAAAKVVAGQSPVGALDVPAVAYAETLAGAGDAAGAAEAYRAAFATIGVKPPAGDLAAQRTAFIRACIADTPIGAALLKDAKDAPAIAGGGLVLSNRPRWSVIGPFANDNWRCYDNPPVKADAVETSKPVEGKAWTVPGPEAYAGEVLNLAALLKQDNSVAFCYVEISSAVAGPGTLSMGADDGLVVWVNGKKVHEDREQRGVQPDSIKLTVPLVKGINRILAMVQQGSGGWGLQARLLTPGWLDTDIARTLRLLADHPDRRADIAAGLATLAETLARNERGPAGDVLARTVLRAFPDCWETQRDVAGRWLDPQQDPVDARDVLLWLDANLPLHPGKAGDAAGLIDLRLWTADRLAKAGEPAVAAELLNGVLWSGFDGRTQGRTLKALGDLYHSGGYYQHTRDYYAQATLLPTIDEGEERAVRQGLARLPRARRRGAEYANVPLDIATTLRGAVRAVETGDLEHAISAFQKAIETDRGQVLAIDGGREVGVSMWCTEQLRGMGAAGSTAYRTRFEASASAASASAAVRDDVDEGELVAATWPLTLAAEEALANTARGYLDRGAWWLAAATVAKLPESALASRRALLTEAIRAAGLAADEALHAALSARAGTAAAVKTAEKPPSWPTGAQAAVPFTIPLATLRDLRRFVPEGGRTVHAACQPAIADGIAYLDTGSESLAVELVGGKVRWRTPFRSDDSDDRFRGMPSTQPALCGGLVIARALVAGRQVLQARRREDGGVAWTAAPAGLGAVSSPVSDGARIIALFANHAQVSVAAFTPDGDQSWVTTLPVPRAALGAEKTGVDLGARMATPTVAGRDVYVATDVGAVFALDSGSGRVRWLGRYPVATLDGEQRGTMVQLLGRAPGRVVVAGGRVAVLPRDSLGLFCFERADGALVWSREFISARILAGADPRAGLVLQGAEVECVDLATGATRWRWRPRDGAPIGQAALDAQGVTVATASALVRLAFADGSIANTTLWRELGVAGSAPGSLAWADQRLVACGNGGVVVLGTGAAVAGLPALVPSAPTTRAQALATLPLANGEGCTVRWRLDDDGLIAIERPHGSMDGECYALGERSLTRLDALTAKVVWRTALTADARIVDWSADAILVRMRGVLGMLSRADGSVLWMSPIDENAARALIDAQLPDVAFRAGVVLVYRNGGNAIDVRDARTGRQLWRITLPHSAIHVATAIDGEIHVLTRRDDKLWAEVRSLSDSAKTESVNLKQTSKDVWAWADPASRTVLVMGRITGFYDPAKRSFISAPIPMRDNFAAWHEASGLLHCIGARDNRWSSVVLDMAKPGIVFNAEFANAGGMSAERMRPLAWYPAPGGRRLRLLRDHGGKTGLACRGADGVDAWFAPGGDRNQRSPIAVNVIGQTAVALYGGMDGMSAQTIALTDGRILAETRVPGYASERVAPLVVGDTLLYASDGALIALGLGAPPAVAGEGVPAERELRDLVRAASEPRTVATRLSATPVIDGQLTDWPAEATPIVLGPLSVRARPDAAIPSGEARVRVGWDSVGLHLAVEAVATGWHPPAALGATGDGVLVAIDADGDDRRPPLLLALTLVDGRSRVEVVEGQLPGDLGPADQPRVRIAAGAAGATYELVVPWPVLRARANQRPGDKQTMSLGVAVITADGAAHEWGHGIVRGFSPNLLPTIELAK